MNGVRISGLEEQGRTFRPYMSHVAAHRRTTRERARDEGDVLEFAINLSMIVDVSHTVKAECSTETEEIPQ